MASEKYVDGRREPVKSLRRNAGGGWDFAEVGQIKGRNAPVNLGVVGGFQMVKQAVGAQGNAFHLSHCQKAAFLAQDGGLDCVWCTAHFHACEYRWFSVSLKCSVQK
jgi:hypothetical protein